MKAVSISINLLLLSALLFLGCTTIGDWLGTAPTPWELASAQCETYDSPEREHCHLAVGLAIEACAQGKTQLFCADPADDELCDHVTLLLQTLCQQPEAI